jgi:4-amino-4-deoxy-L-arabinose transferase-like glycosyltransferase
LRHLAKAFNGSWPAHGDCGGRFRHDPAWPAAGRNAERDKTKLNRMPPFWATPRFVLSAILVYLVAHLAIRMAMGAALSIDGAEQALFSQHFAWTYRYKAPPLFTWALAALGWIMPVNALSIALLRYGLLGTLYICIYLVARRLIADPRLSALSVYSFAAIGTFAEASHRNLTHSTAHAALLAVGWYVFLRLAAAPQLGWYLALGAVFGLGIVAKWNFVIFAVALPLTCLASREWRRLILSWRILPAALVAAAIVLPTVVATLRMGPPPGEDVRSVLGAESGPDLETIVGGTLKLLDTAIIYALPLVLVALVLFALPLWRGLRAEAQRAAGHPCAEDGDVQQPSAAFVGMTMAIGMLLLWLIVLVLGATEFKVRYLYPVLLILPVWLFMTIERGRPSDRMVNLFALIMEAATVFVAGKRLAEVAGFTECSLCVESRAYPALAEQLEDAGYDGAGTILVSDETAGDLRVIFSAARIIDPAYAQSSWPRPADHGPCLLVWEAGGGAETVPALYTTYLTEAMGGRLDAPHVDGTAADSEYPLGYRLYREPNGDCR